MDSESQDAPDTLPSLPLEEWQCEGCGLSLAGLRVATCPSCGRPIGPTGPEGAPFKSTPLPARAPTQTDTGGPISAEWELACTHCGYDLTGLTTRVCPECGRSFHPRKTWLANRDLPFQRREFRKVVLTLVVLTIWGVGAYFLPFWLLPLPILLVVELIYWRYDWNPKWIRILFLPLYVLWMLLAVVIALG
jgi:hypothetical protein